MRLCLTFVLLAASLLSTLGTVPVTAASITFSSPVGADNVHYDNDGIASAAPVKVQSVYYETPLVGAATNANIPSLSHVVSETASDLPAATFASRYDDYGPGLDATTSDELCGLVHRIHADPSASQEFTRPVYAPQTVVNDAYIAWNEHGPKPVGKNYMACQGDIADAIFSTPPGCMAGAATSANVNMKHVGYKRARLNKRADIQTCLFTYVRCVDPVALHSSVDSVRAAVTAELDRNSTPGGDDPGYPADSPYASPAAFWFQRRVYALNSVANAAYRDYYESYGKKPDAVTKALADPDFDVCQRVKDNADSNVGSLFAQFHESEECANGAPMNSFGSACRTVLVECL